MGIDTKGYCLTTNKNVFKVSHIVETAIDSLLLKSAVKKGRMRYDDQNKWTSKEIVSDCSMIRFAFIYKTEQRVIHLHFGCDSDGEHDGLIGTKLIFSLGMWGRVNYLLEVLPNNYES